MDAVRNYFATFGEPVRLFEAKLLLVGEPRAGKTSLKKKLLDPAFQLNQNEASTEGIDIQSWLLPAAETGLPHDFRLNVWDFGGQEIYKATHQFFLTRRSIYLFVLEARKHEETSTDVFYYWFNTVRLLGGASPLLVVQNKCDLPAVDLPMGDYRREFANILPGEERVSCATGQETSIARLRARIIEIVRQLYQKGQLGMELPAQWVAVREQIGRLRRDHIPAWVTDAVYRVVDNKAIIARHGRFGERDLATIWSEPRYRSMHQKLLDLMCKFELCYPLPSAGNQAGDYLAPQLLPGDPAMDLAQLWRSDQHNLHFVYQYEFMPRGILSRLIVRLHQNIYEETHWYYGVLFAWGGARALVREERSRNRIHIRLEGGDRRGLLAIVRREIEAIHRTFGSQLRVAEKIPCNCATCVQLSEPHFYTHASLQSRIESGKREVECENKPHHTVNIRRLIDAVIPPPEEEEEEGRRWRMGREGQFGDIHADSVTIAIVNDSKNVAVGERNRQEVSEGNMQVETTKPKPTETKPAKPVKTINNAWVNGSFYLVTVASLVALFAWISNQIVWYALPIVLIGGLLGVSILGALQLRNDGQLGEKEFVALMVETYKRLPLLRRGQ